jgi:hypothetical protein
LRKSIKNYRQINALQAAFLDFLDEVSAVVVVDDATGVVYLAQEEEDAPENLVFAAVDVAFLDEIVEAEEEV